MLGALACRGCELCTASCPSGLRPAAVIKDIACKLKQNGCEPADAPAARPHPDRPGRRLSRRRWQERLGLSEFAAPAPRLGGTVLPDRLRIATRGPAGAPRVPVVQIGEVVAAGDLIALAPAGSRELDCRSPVLGTVISVDPDDGILVAVR